MLPKNQTDIPDALIESLARLSHIHLEEEERKAISRRLESIFSLIENLSTVDCSNVEPLLHPLDCILAPRSDEPLPEDNSSSLEQIAPLFEAGFYLVPPVISVNEKGSR